MIRPPVFANWQLAKLHRDVLILFQRDSCVVLEKGIRGAEIKITIGSFLKYRIKERDVRVYNQEEACLNIGLTEGNVQGVSFSAKGETVERVICSRGGSLKALLLK